jgi:hypothetical protein
MWLLAHEQGEFIYIPERLAIHRSGSALELAEKYRGGIQTLRRLVRERYGSRANGLIRDSQYFISALYIAGAMNLTDEGDLAGAVSAWLAAAKYRPSMLLEPAMLSRLCDGRNLRRLVKGIGLAVTRARLSL